MTSRPALLAVCALSLAWITSSAVYLYPGVKEKVDEMRYLHRVEKLHTPVLPLECGQARGVENRDFIREDRHSDRCWVTIATFNSLYPEIAEATDLGATLRSNMLDASRWRIGRGHHLKPCCEPPVSSSARQQSSRSLWLPGLDVRSGLPEPRRGRQSFTFCP